MTLVKLMDGKTGNYFSFLPDYGATMMDFAIMRNGRRVSLLDGYKSRRDLAKNSTLYKGSKLFPFPNRIRDGKYAYKGTTYRLPINFPSQNHSIHGLVHDQPFKVIKQKTDGESASVTVEYKYDGKEPGYPFKYRLAVTFKFKGEEVQISTTCQNTDKRAIPVGDGWHPYFKLAGKVDDLYLKAPSTEIMTVDKRLIVRGKSRRTLKYQKPTRIKDSFFDTCFRINGKDRAETLLINREKNLKLSVIQEAGKNGYNFVQIYTPIHRKSIAIEPVTCPSNAFNNGIGLVNLVPKGKFTTSYSIRINPTG